MIVFFISCAQQSKPIESEIRDTAIDGPQCVETGQGEMPENVEWIVLDGNSEDIFHLGVENALTNEYQGNYGIYDLNSVAFEGGNGFLLERPGRVVGAEVQWGNLPEENNPVELHFWPNFGSNGYTWNRDTPYVSITRCLSQQDDAEWVSYVLPEAIDIPQPIHVFVGYSRAERDMGTPSVTPEIYQENYQQSDEPFWAGAWFLGVDDEIFYHGMTTPWYTFRIRLAVVYDEEIPEEQRNFTIHELFSSTSRGSWGDFDRDGDDDLMVGGPLLYQNNGDGTFEEITDSHLFTDGSSNGGVWGDFDNDGCLDFFGQGYEDILLHNNCNRNGEGYALTDVTLQSGIHDIQDDRDCDGNDEPEVSPTEGSAWIDIDGDGYLDIFMANYECSSDFDFYKNYDDRLWRNKGDGTFEEWTEFSQIPSSNLAGRGATSIDYDLDGDHDLFVSNYRLDPNYFLLNNGDGTVTDIARDNGTKGDFVQGNYGHTIGTVFGDIDNDGDFDMIQANLAHPFYYWFSNKSKILIQEQGNFADESIERGIYYRETHSNPTLFDADNDGDLDLFITSIYAVRDSDFYLNDGNGFFELSNYQSGLVVKNGWGSAASDFDHDGDVDIFTRQFFENRGTDNKNWIEIQLVGGIVGGPLDQWTGWKGTSNLSGIGANVMIQTSENTQMRYVSGGSGTGVQDSLTLHVGINEAQSADLQVFFLGGTVIDVPNVPANGKIWIHEDGSTYTGFDVPIEFFPPLLDPPENLETTF